MRVRAAFALACLFVPTLPTYSQSLPQSIKEQTPDAVMTERKNAWTIGIVSGQLEGLYPRFAHEMQKNLDDGDNLRIMPILAYGAASNVDDLLYTKGVDVAFTQSDVLLYFKDERNIHNIQNRIHYITALYNAELHIIARPEIKTIYDLEGKNVSFGPPGNSASLTGPIVFQRLGIKVEPIFLDHSTGIEKMKTAEVDAVIRVIGKPHDYFGKLSSDLGFHFIGIPFSDISKKLFDDVYSLGELNHKDYPNLINEGKTIDTISVPNLLAVYNWEKNSDRYRRVERFVEALFEKFPNFQKPPNHPKWRDINLGAEIPGWTRSQAAERMITKISKNTNLEKDFNEFIKSKPKPRTNSDRDALFRQFMSWRDRTSTQ